MGLIRTLNSLDPAFQPQAAVFIDRLKAAALSYTVIETLRTLAVQTAYYAQGREPLDAVNKKRTLAGLCLITAEENRRAITQTMKSVHLDGKAIDVVPLTIDGKIPWVINTQEIADLYKKFGEIGRSVGLEWGGDWKPLDRWGIGWDPPHYQKAG
jgi:peptidoglycan L-alanyl-D-glutamate endopeptidase CwlK